jgi:3-methyl-2-oxobutanoate hydroxymethyltransferase
MSSHTTPARKGRGINSTEQVQAVTAPDIANAKGQRKITVLTAYDYPTACMVDAGGVDMIHVGDSMGNVVLGRPDTVSVTLDEVILLSRAVVAGVERALVAADMPFMTYETGVKDALKNAGRMVRESGVRAVKLEGGEVIAPQVQALVQAGIPVVGHIGLTPQRVGVLGGFKVQGKSARAAARLLEDALALERAGCFSIVLEAVPSELAKIITKAVGIPTIGIGAGPHCDGQVLVTHDMLGMTPGRVPKFVKQYAAMAEAGTKAVEAYVREVVSGEYPAREHSYAMPAVELEELKRLVNK